jgi:tRNA (adenine57-N1/adenine58-N1)-methyltransferase
VEDKRFLKRITKDFNLNYKKRTLKFEDVVGKEFGIGIPLGFVKMWRL